MVSRFMLTFADRATVLWNWARIWLPVMVLLRPAAMLLYAVGRLAAAEMLPRAGTAMARF